MEDKFILEFSNKNDKNKKNVRQFSSHSEQLTRNHSNNITRKASSRVKKEHKISFKVVSIAGSEDQAVCEIKNPSDDSPAIVKYFQMLRK